MVARLGNIIVGVLECGGCYQDWDQTIRFRVIPRVLALAIKSPDKVIVCLDREKHPDCAPELASRALSLIKSALVEANITTNVAVIVADRCFEAILFADYNLLDRLSILSVPVSGRFGQTLDGTFPVTVVNNCTKHGEKYRKVEHGKALAQMMLLENEEVLSRSRSLRKLVKEASPPSA
jgi:hypothetical protein